MNGKMSTRFLVGLVSILWIFFTHTLFAQSEINSDSILFVQYKNAAGEVISEGYLENGKPNGYWKTFYPGGILKSEGNREFFQLSGAWYFYSDEGDTLEMIDYRRDKKNGYHIRWEYEKDRGGNKVKRLIYKELYLNNKKENKSLYYRNGLLFQEINFENGERNGLSREFADDGRIVRLMTYRNGVMISSETINQFNKNAQKSGNWKEFYSSGQVHIVCTYLDGKLDGIYKEYNQQGQVIRTVRYQDGELMIAQTEEERPVKYKKSFHSNGKIKSSGGFMGEIAVGLHQEYTEEGILSTAVIYSDYGIKESEGLMDEAGRKTGEWKEFYEDGSLRAYGKYVENKRNGEWVFLFPNGNIEQKGFYRENKYDGIWIWYYDTGEIWRSEEYLRGREDGEFSEFNRDGSIIAQGLYVDGRKEGAWLIHSGDHLEKGEFRDGLKEGKWKYYYSNEKIKFEGTFIQGQEDGKHLWYFENGRIEEERFYIYGSKEKVWKRYLEDGTLDLSITYRNDKEYKINGKIIEKKD